MPPGSRQAAILGFTEGGPLALLLAASLPVRCGLGGRLRAFWRVVRSRRIDVGIRACGSVRRSGGELFEYGEELVGGQGAPSLVGGRGVAFCEPCE
jgi:hypothetical protein